MRNLFLTGAVGVGKSTVLRRVLDRIPAHVGGFLTERTNADRRKPRFAFRDLRTGTSVPLARWTAVGLHADESVFVDAGVPALRRARERVELLVMDELGRMELEAPVFQREVLTALNGRTPVLGVLKAERNPFLDRVRAHPAVDVWAVTEENREALVDRVAGFVREAVRHARLGAR